MMSDISKISFHDNTVKEAISLTILISTSFKQNKHIDNRKARWGGLTIIIMRMECKQKLHIHIICN